MIVGSAGRVRCCERLQHGALWVMLAAALTGCGRGVVSPPKINASSASQAAISKYDKNGDGVLSGTELKNAPGFAASRCDANKDGTITADEISERIGKWQTDRVGLITMQLQVLLNGKPLNDALVKFIPEECIADKIQPGQGTTGELGLTNIGMDPGQLRSDLQGSPLMHCGIYRVEITHPTKKIPSQYNTETILGHEVAIDNVDIPYTIISLKSN